MGSISADESGDSQRLVDGAPSQPTERQSSHRPNTREGRPHFDQIARAAILGLGLLIVVIGLLAMFVPTWTTVSEKTTTTTAPPAGETNTVESGKTTMTETPGLERSGVSVVAILTIGVGLLVVAGLWHRIQEFAFGGVTIKLRVDLIPADAIPAADVAVGAASAPDITAGNEITEAVRKIALGDLRIVKIDLQDGELWAPINLCLFVLLLADRTHTEVLVFTDRCPAGPDTYIGAANVPTLADHLAAIIPGIADARQDILLIPPLGKLTSDIGGSVGARFLEIVPAGTQPVQLVSSSVLSELAGRELITQSLDSNYSGTLARQQQRAILSFPLSYVPMTNRCHLIQIVDRSHVAERIALASVGMLSESNV